jgi:hypothetical protein
MRGGTPVIAELQQAVSGARPLGKWPWIVLTLWKSRWNG